MPFPRGGGGSGLDQLTGDVTAGPGTGSQAATVVATTNVESIIAANATVAGALQKTGGTMSGAIAMGANKITGIANGSASTDAAAFGQIPAPSVLATATETELTTTGATNVVTYTPSSAGNFEIGIYFRVVTATTTVTVTVTWTDVTGAQTLTLLNGVSEVTGSYAMTKFMINSAASDAITVTFTAGTSNQVYASASIVGN